MPNCPNVVEECPALRVFSPTCSTGFIWGLDGKEQRNHERSDLSAAAALNVSLRRALSSDILRRTGKTLGKSCKILEEWGFFPLPSLCRDPFLSELLCDSYQIGGVWVAEAVGRKKEKSSQHLHHLKFSPSLFLLVVFFQLKCWEGQPQFNYKPHR